MLAVDSYNVAALTGDQEMDKDIIRDFNQNILRTLVVSDYNMSGIIGPLFVNIVNFNILASGSWMAEWLRCCQTTGTVNSVSTLLDAHYRTVAIKAMR